MLKPNLIQSLPELPTPVLTVYLDTDLAKAGSSELAAAKLPYLARLESQVQGIARTVPQEEKKSFETQVERVRAHLLSHAMPYRGIVIFAGIDVWELLPLQVRTEDEVHWGDPFLAQLLWLLDEHRPYGIVLAGRKGVRFLVVRLGEMLESEAIEFRLKESRRKEMGPVARPGVRMSRGTNRDVFTHHVDAQYRHFNREIAKRIEQWHAAERLDSVFLVGLGDMVRGVQGELPKAVQKEMVLVEEDLGWMSHGELQERIAPLVASHEREREVWLVEQLLGSERGVVVGVDETLAQLQQGRISRVAVYKGFNGDARQCVRCGQADRTADPVCPACKGERKRVSLRGIFPGLARRYQVAVEVVSGEAAQKLKEAGGIGAWLREFEKKEYRSTAASRV
jgi:Bacterial archaeo-eukaryotic release factor family 10